MTDLYAARNTFGGTPQNVFQQSAQGSQGMTNGYGSDASGKPNLTDIPNTGMGAPPGLADLLKARGQQVGGSMAPPAPSNVMAPEGAPTSMTPPANTELQKFQGGIGQDQRQSMMQALMAKLGAGGGGGGVGAPGGGGMAAAGSQGGSPAGLSSQQMMAMLFGGA